MVEQLFSIFIAILGLGFLVFIHELGHYIVARREGMTIEVFSIGFGPPIVSWIWQGVRWQLCWLPFGGYVKIAGMQKEGSREPFEIVGGFFNKKPIQRIRVAIMGPLVNIAFAFVAFFVLWCVGGEKKPFSEFTHRVGWVDPQSKLYDQGIRAGDLINSCNGRPVEGLKDVYIASIMKTDVMRITGSRADSFSVLPEKFDYTVPLVESSRGKTFEVLKPANYCIFKEAAPHSPILSTGIEPGDRILWADGEAIYSLEQLQSLVNASTAFLTVRRGDEIIQIKAPRIHLDDLKLTPVQRAEFDDWQHEADLKGRLDDLYFIPYLLSPSGEVEVRLSFLEENLQQSYRGFPQLEEGDYILAVDGQKISSPYEMLQRLQARHILLIVQKDPLFSSTADVSSWRKADEEFYEFSDGSDLHSLVSVIGTNQEISQIGRLHLLAPVEPKPLRNFSSSQQINQMRKEIEAIPDLNKRQEFLKRWEKEQNRMILGVYFSDKELRYNPGPLHQFLEVFTETGRVLKNLVTGSLHPKHVSGPVGIIHIVQKRWSVGGAKEGLFWMGVISLNLGLMNLLPIPVLDGGHILFSLYELVTRRRLSSKAMERFILPFMGLLIALFVYITYQDVIRLFARFF